MKPQIALSPDQMHELKSLGLDCSDASMCWVSFSDGSCYLVVNEPREEDIEFPIMIVTPAYTLEDILLKLEGISPRYMIEPNMSDWFYSVSYPTTDRRGSNKLFTSLNNPIKPVLEMLKWVLVTHPDKIKKL